LNDRGKVIDDRRCVHKCLSNELRSDCVRLSRTWRKGRLEAAGSQQRPGLRRRIGASARQMLTPGQ
jgi:hypothetical protein